MITFKRYSARSIWSHMCVAFLSWFGCGLLRKAPGTMGSIGALPFAALIAWFWGTNSLVIAALILFLLGWMVTSVHIKNEKSCKAPQWIVIDEVSGQWATLAVVPLNPYWYAIAFLIFRLFDILKPWPIDWADKRVAGALGIMLDDIFAAIYALFLLLVLKLLWSHIT